MIIIIIIIMYIYNALNDTLSASRIHNKLKTILSKYIHIQNIQRDRQTETESESERMGFTCSSFSQWEPVQRVEMNSQN